MTSAPISLRPASFIRRLEAGEAQTVVFYGTSLTAAGAWVGRIETLLSQRFGPLVTTHNGAESGQHSTWGRAHLDERVLRYAPDVVFLEFAVNDAVARFHISPDAARDNLNAMLDRILAARPACEIILQVMNPVIDRPEGHDGWRPELPRYQQLYRDTAHARGLTLIDHMPAWSDLLARDKPTFRAWVPDGLHPAAEGYDHVVVPEIRRILAL